MNKSSNENAEADRRLFVLSPNAHAAFAAILDRPATPKPRLTSLLAEPAPWDES